jgi:tripartite-type tricarboxylate transporter receptor subunit TctC
MRTGGVILSTLASTEAPRTGGLHGSTDQRHLRYSREVQAAMHSPDLQARLRAQALESIVSNGAETNALIKTTAERWRTVITSSNIRAD